MRTSELLYAMAKWLESSDNEALCLAEADEHCLKVVAESCVLAAELLKKAADEVDQLEPQETFITPESIEETAALANAFDESNDPQLKRMASVLDELLLSIAAPPGVKQAKEAEDYGRIEELRKKYQQPRQDLKDYNKIGLSEKAIKDSKFLKEYKINDQLLSARNCPQHPGSQLQRIGEHMVRCELDGRTYNYETGYTLDDGTKVPGGLVSLQTGDGENIGHNLFDTREGRLSSYR
jgi:hypothetical protein